jgi:hypothetical protein
MKFLRRLGFALLTFVLGVAMSPIRFYVEGMGCGKMADGGGGFGITSYSSSYFVKLWSAQSAYASPEKADEAFNRQLSQAVNVVELGPKVNRDGVVVGRRAMAIFYSPQLSRNYTQILWTNGRFLHYIGSTSTMHVKEFERQRR